MKAFGQQKIWVLRLFSGSWTLILAGAAWLLHGLFPESRFWLWPLVAAMLLATGLVFPKAMRHPYRLVERIFAPLGQLMALIMLALVYFGVFALFAVVLRLVGWDPLCRQRRRQTGSAWRKHPAGTDYHWQY